MPCDFSALTVGAVGQTPASAPAIPIGVVVQGHAAGGGDHQTWTLVATQLKGLLIRNGNLEVEIVRCVIRVFCFFFLSFVFAQAGTGASPAASGRDSPRRRCRFESCR